MSRERETRQILGARFREGFLGPSFDQKTYCPVGVPGIVFDPENPAHTAPFTTAEVLGNVGYALLSVDHLGSRGDGVASGVDHAGALHSHRTVIVLARFTLHLPDSGDRMARVEDLQDRLETLFAGATFRHDGPPAFTLRQPTTRPPTYREGRTEDAGWTVRSVEMRFEREERVQLAGLQEV